MKREVTDKFSSSLGADGRDAFREGQDRGEERDEEKGEEEERRRVEQEKEEEDDEDAGDATEMRWSRALLGEKSSDTLGLVFVREAEEMDAEEAEEEEEEQGEDKEDEEEKGKRKPGERREPLYRL